MSRPPVLTSLCCKLVSDLVLILCGNASCRPALRIRVNLRTEDGGEVLLEIATVKAGLIEGMLEQELREKKLGRESEHGGFEAEGEPGEDLGGAQEAGMTMRRAGDFESLAGAVEEGAKDELGHDGEVDHAEALSAELSQAQVGFPGLEEHFNAPAKTVEDGEDLRGPEVGGDIGDEDIPAQQAEVFTAGMERCVAIAAQEAAALVGDGHGDGAGDQTDRDLSLFTEQHGAIERAVLFKASGQRDEAVGGGIEDGDLMTIAGEEKGLALGDAGEHGQDEIAQIANDQIARFEQRQDIPGSALVIAGKSGEGDLLEVALEQVGDDLNLELGEGAVLIGATGKKSRA
jgi:hypothetical protein